MFKRLTLVVSLLVFFAGTAVSAERYKMLSTTQPTSTPGKVEVVELFWYGCNHCHDLEPVLQQWLKTKPDYIEYVRVPAIFRENWMPLARAWYVIETLELGDQVHMNLFKAIHEKKLNMNNEGLLRSFFGNAGVSAEQFDKLYNSFSIDSMVRNAAKLTRNYQITGVPAIIVNGRYLTTVSLTGSREVLIETIDSLAAKEAEAMGLLTSAE